MQVAAEFLVNATSPRRRFRLTNTDATALLETWLAYPTLPLTPERLRSAVALYQRYQLSYWDAAIITAARLLNCHTVYSEDLNHGQDYDGVRVINPFLESPTVDVPPEQALS